MKITILSASFRRPSVTHATGVDLAAQFGLEHDVDLLDASELGGLPLVGFETDGVDAVVVGRFERALAAADAVVVGMPCYRASMSGAGKGLIDYFGDHLANKPIGVYVAAGGLGALLAVSDLDRPLALDLGCAVAPQRLLVSGDSVEDQHERLSRFVESFTRFALCNQDETVLVG
jgi:NAD(P)H-dependent FMN reductase